MSDPAPETAGVPRARRLASIFAMKSVSTGGGTGLITGGTSATGGGVGVGGTLNAGGCGGGFSSAIGGAIGGTLGAGLDGAGSARGGVLGACAGGAAGGVGRTAARGGRALEGGRSCVGARKYAVNGGEGSRVSGLGGRGAHTISTTCSNIDASAAMAMRGMTTPSRRA